MQTVFVNGNPAPSNELISQAFHSTLEARPTVFDGVEEQFHLRGWPLRYRIGTGVEATLIRMVPGEGKQWIKATFTIDSDRYCINPYDCAIYTGWEFSTWDFPGEDDHVTEMPKDYYLPRYQWGMFERSPSGQYNSVPLAIQLSDDRRCIRFFRPKALFAATVK